MSGLLLKSEELLDGALYIALWESQSDWWVFRAHDEATFARSRASGMALSTSLVKSLSAFRRPSDMMGECVLCVRRERLMDGIK